MVEVSVTLEQSSFPVERVLLDRHQADDPSMAGPALRHNR
jgi:hypothetical protein